MKSLLNLILIVIVCSFANAANSTKTIPVTGSKTLPGTNKITTTKTLPIKTIPSSSVTSTASLPPKIQYYTTIVTAYGHITQTTVLPNDSLPYTINGCIPTKGYHTMTKEYCSVSSSITYCKPDVTTKFSVSSYCKLATKSLSFTIPVTSKTCYTTYEECNTKTRKFSKTVLPFEDYYNYVKEESNRSSTVPSKTVRNLYPLFTGEVLSYAYEDCEYVTRTMDCYYPVSTFNYNDITITTKTIPTNIISTTEVPSETITENDITTSQVSTSTINNTVSLPPKPTPLSTFPPKDTKSISISLPPKTTTQKTTKTTTFANVNMNYYTTTLSDNGITVTLSEVPIRERVTATGCKSTKTITEKGIKACSTVNGTTTQCSKKLTTSYVNKPFCTYSTEHLRNPMKVTATNCQSTQYLCATKTIYSTYTQIDYSATSKSRQLFAKTVLPLNSVYYIGTKAVPTEICTSIVSEVDCVVPITDVITFPTKSTTTNTIPITIPPESTIITETTTTTPTPAITDCPPVTITYTEKETITEIEKETITVTVKATPTNVDDDSKCVGKYEQCGGEGYNGPTCCKNGLTCHRISRYFSQCD